MVQYKSPSTVTADIKRNRLIIKLRGTVPKKDTDQIYTDVRFCVSDLKPGFVVITDLTEAKIGHLAGIDSFRKIATYLAEKQVGPIIRVVGPSKIIFQQLAKITNQLAIYKPMYVKSMEEAEDLLKELLKDQPVV